MATQNNGGNQNLRPFEKGRSGNPGGRPSGKGLAKAVRAKVPADELARWYSAIWLRDEEELAALNVKLSEVTLAQRNAAAEWLSDHGYGKAPAHAPVEGGDPLERDAADAAIDQIMDELAARREAPAVGPDAGVELAGDGTA